MREVSAISMMASRRLGGTFFLKFLIAALFLCLSSLLADVPSPGRKYTTLQRIEEKHLVAVHQARLRLAQERKPISQAGPWRDFRAAIHVHAEDSEHTKGTRLQVPSAAEADGISVVMFDRRHAPCRESPGNSSWRDQPRLVVPHISHSVAGCCAPNHLNLRFFDRECSPAVPLV